MGLSRREKILQAGPNAAAASKIGRSPRKIKVFEEIRFEKTQKSEKRMITYEQALDAINTLREKFKRDGESVDLFGKEIQVIMKSILKLCTPYYLKSRRGRLL